MDQQEACCSISGKHTALVRCRWRGGEVERWRGGEVERWRGGEVERWRGGEVAGTAAQVTIR
jgi:hypothetical protein